MPEGDAAGCAMEGTADAIKGAEKLPVAFEF
jgi:hypothetical protein